MCLTSHCERLVITADIFDPPLVKSGVGAVDEDLIIDSVRVRTIRDIDKL